MTITNATALRATAASPAPGALTDHELLNTLPRLVAHERRATVALIAHLAELDARRLYRGAGFASAHAYCVHALHLSEHAAYLRIEAARWTRRFPRLLAELAAGRLHLTALAQLGPHLTMENLDEVLTSARHRTRREIDTLVERIRTAPPRPAPARCELRAVPVKWRAEDAPIHGAEGGAADPSSGAALALGTASPEVTHPGQLFADVPAAEAPDPREGAPRAARHTEARPAERERVGTPSSGPGRAEPPAADAICYRLHITIHAATRAKLERARALLGRAAALDAAVDQEAAILDRALDLLLERLERRKWGRRRAEGGPSGRGRRAPAASGTSASSPAGAADRDTETGPRAACASRYIPAPVRRAVFRRDGGQCAFVAASGRRCPATRGLEFHHREPWARGGAATASNIALFCRAHNVYEAECEFGARLAAGRPAGRPASCVVLPEPPADGTPRPAGYQDSVRTEFAPG